MMALGVIGSLARLWLLTRREKQVLGAVERIPHSCVIDVEEVRYDGSRTHLRIARQETDARA